MKPQGFPAGIGVIRVGLVAVQHHDLPRPGGIGLAVQLDGAAAFFDIHDEKTVIGIPLQTVSGRITEITGTHRVKKGLDSLGAGRVQVVVGAFKNSRFSGAQQRFPLSANYSYYRGKQRKGQENKKAIF